MSQWRKPPPAVILSGTESFLRLRELREAVAVAEASGRTVEEVKGGDREELVSIVSSTGVFFSEDVLVVVNDPETVDEDFVLRHHEAGSSAVALVLHQEGAIKAKSSLGRIAKKLPGRLVARFDKPKPWEEVERSVEFCVREATRRKIELSEALAAAVVRASGTELGVLAFEIEKMALLVRAEGGDPKVNGEQVRRTLGALAGLGPKSVVEALARRDHAGTGRALTSVRRAHAGPLGGAVLRVCAFVGGEATRWLHAGALAGRDFSVEEIADKLEVHPFVVRRNLLPATKRWGQGRLISLLTSMARVERSVRSGHVNSWAQLECALFSSLAEEVVG